MHGRKSEKGVFLIFTAILLPLIFLCIAFAVDLGYAYAGKSKLQNAADASVLACAHQYSNGTEAVKSAVNAYMKSNLGNSNYKINSLTYGKKDNDNSNSVLITLVVSQDQPTFFSKIIGIKKIPVSVKASSLVVPKKEEAEDTIFKYAMFGDRFYEGYPPPDMSWGERSDDWTFRFNLPGTIIHGPFYTNGATSLPGNVGPNGKRYVYLDDKSYFTYAGGLPATSKHDADYWRWTNGEYISRGDYEYKMSLDVLTSSWYWHTLYANNVPIQMYGYAIAYYYMYRMAYNNGTSLGKDIVANNSTYVPNRLSAALDEDDPSRNPLTSSIATYIADVLYNSQNGKYGNVHIAVQNQGVFKQKKVMDVIITNRDIEFDNRNYRQSNDPNYHVVLISLEGNITIGDTYRKLNALVYAPRGKVTYRNRSDFEGSIVGRTIEVYTNPVFTQNDFGFGKDSGGSGATGDGSVQLYIDDANAYAITERI